MALRNLTLGGNVGISEKDMPKMVLLQRTRDFSVAANTVTAADVLQMLNVPAGFFCMGVFVDTQTVEWSTSTPCQVGDGADTDGWLTTSMCLLNNTATDFCSSTSAYGALLSGRGKFYPSADTIDIIPKISLDAAKVRVGAWGFMAEPGNDTAF